jgi:hypothetical protein
MGTYLHKLVEDYVKRGIHPEEYKGLTITVDDGTLFGYTFVIDNEIIEAVNKCIFLIKQYDRFKVETLVNFSDLLGDVTCPDFHIEDEGFGTCDGIAYSKDGVELHIYDWKFGRGVKVLAKEYEDEFDPEKLNPQLGLYAYGAYNELDEKRRATIKYIKITVVQPLMDHEDSAVITVKQLREFAQYVKLRAGYVGTNKFNVTKNGCKWCSGKASCPAIWEELMDLTEEDDL